MPERRTRTKPAPNGMKHLLPLLRREPPEEEVVAAVF